MRSFDKEMSTEYFKSIDHRINTGIKKLQQMDKRLAMYDSRHKNPKDKQPIKNKSPTNSPSIDPTPTPTPSNNQQPIDGPLPRVPKSSPQ
jgi:hypothetical protein